jgi:hypothetical protein
MHGSVAGSVLLSEVALSCNAAEHHKAVRIAGQNSDLIGLRRDSRSLIYVSQKGGVGTTCLLGVCSAGGRACLDQSR